MINSVSANFQDPRLCRSGHSPNPTGLGFDKRAEMRLRNCDIEH